MKVVSEVEIVPIHPTKGIVAFASFVLYETISCSSVAIMTRPNGGYRLVYPTKKVGNRMTSIFHPIARKVGSTIEKEVIKKYEEVTKGEYNARYFNPSL